MRLDDGGHGQRLQSGSVVIRGRYTHEWGVTEMAKKTTHTRKSSEVMRCRHERWLGVVTVLQNVMGDLVDENKESLLDIATRAEMSPQTLRKFLDQDVRSPHFDVVLALFSAFNLDFNLIMGNRRQIRLTPDSAEDFLKGREDAKKILNSRKGGAGLSLRT